MIRSLLAALLVLLPMVASANTVLPRWFVHFEPGANADNRHAAIVAAIGRDPTPEVRFRGDAMGEALRLTGDEALLAAAAVGIERVAQHVVIETATGAGRIDLDFAIGEARAPLRARHAEVWDAVTRTITLQGSADPYTEPANRYFALVGSTGTTHAVVEDPAGAAVVRIGVDSNNDGLPSPGEERCVSPSIDGVASCVVRGAGWMMVSSARAGPSPVVVVSGGVQDPSGSASDPRGYSNWISADGLSGEDGIGSARWSVDIPKLADGASVFGSINLERVELTVGKPQYFDRVPVRVLRRGIEYAPYALREGYKRQMLLRSFDQPRSLVVDIDHGSLGVSISIQRRSNTDARIAYFHDPDPDYSGPTIHEGPQLGDPGVQVVNTGQLLISTEDYGPTHGRWYIIPINTNPTNELFSIQMGTSQVLQEDAERIRPGSYYDSKRPGHGVFLYGTGGYLSMLWYTYDDDGNPTWYYTEGPDVESGSPRYVLPLFRTSWALGQQTHYPIGNVSLVPIGPGEFTMTWTIDGRTGTSHFEPFLSGCPLVGGAPLDASGHWFDPVRSGTGYSVQVAPNYEFFAAFLYDERGRPRFLAAERGGPFDAGSPVLELHQLHGFGPFDPWKAPTRTWVGTLERSYVDGTLDTVRTEAGFVNGLPGGWDELDDVQSLGETQGCVP